MQHVRVRILIAAEPIVREALAECLRELEPAVYVLPAAPNPNDLPALIAVIAKSSVDVLVHHWDDPARASEAYEAILSAQPDLRILNARHSGIGTEVRRSIVCKQFSCDSLDELAQAVQHQITLSKMTGILEASQPRTDDESA